jgi:hypothetical protein
MLLTRLTISAVIGVEFDVAEAGACCGTEKRAGNSRPVFDYLQCYLIEQLRLKDDVQVGWK